MSKATWTVDQAHSSIEFIVRHMMISKVKGNFNTFEGIIEADPEDLTDASIEFTIDVASIDTRQEKRDEHLRSTDFFDVENYPHITFKSTNIKSASNNTYNVTGNLTIKDTTKPVTFVISYEGMAKDPMSGGEVAGFNGEATINRSEFGITWNAPLETGGVVVSDEVKIELEMQVKK